MSVCLQRLKVPEHPAEKHPSGSSAFLEMHIFFLAYPLRVLLLCFVRAGGSRVHCVSCNFALVLFCFPECVQAKPPDVTTERWIENMNDCIIKVAGLELKHLSEEESNEEEDDEKRWAFPVCTLPVSDLQRLSKEVEEDDKRWASVRSAGTERRGGGG